MSSASKLMFFLKCLPIAKEPINAKPFQDKSSSFKKLFFYKMRMPKMSCSSFENVELSDFWLNLQALKICFSMVLSQNWHF